MRLLTVFAAVVCGCSAPPTSPTPHGDGESCAKPFLLTGASPLVITATTAGFADDDGSMLSSCGGGGAPDVVFTFNAAIGAIVDVKVTPSGTGFQPIVKLRGADKGCLDADAACDSAISRGQVAELTSWAPAVGGIQSIIVDGQAQTSGAFTLEVKQR